MLSPWDAKQMLLDTAAEVRKFTPLLEQMHPQQWLDNGAPPAYASQYLSARDRIADVQRALTGLSNRPDSLSLAVDTYFRMEALEIVLRSLNECVRKYGESRTADQLASSMAAEFNAREKFRGYLRDLSTQREQDFKVADEEAQRCRGMIGTEASPASSTRKVHKK
jgi:hypothetical protein